MMSGVKLLEQLLDYCIRSGLPLFALLQDPFEVLNLLPQ